MEPLTVATAEAQRLSGLGKTKLFELIASGELDSVKIGRKRLVKIESLCRLLNVDVVGSARTAMIRNALREAGVPGEDKLVLARSRPGAI